MDLKDIKGKVDSLLEKTDIDEKIKENPEEVKKEVEKVLEKTDIDEKIIGKVEGLRLFLLPLPVVRPFAARQGLLSPQIGQEVVLLIDPKEIPDGGSEGGQFLPARQDKAPSLPGFQDLPSPEGKAEAVRVGLLVGVFHMVAAGGNIL